MQLIRCLFAVAALQATQAVAASDDWIEFSPGFEVNPLSVEYNETGVIMWLRNAEPIDGTYPYVRALRTFDCKAGTYRDLKIEIIDGATGKAIPYPRPVETKPVEPDTQHGMAHITACYLKKLHDQRF